MSRTKRKWISDEDVALVVCMVELHNVGTFNANTGFKVGYLGELQRVLQKILPYANMKAKPNLEPRIRTLKKDWTIIYDMIIRKDTNGFG